MYSSIRRDVPYIAISIFWLLVCYMPPYFLDAKMFRALGVEGSFYETSGAFFLLFSSICFFYLFFLDLRAYRVFMVTCRYNLFFFLLGSLFLFGAGEEISWGQRIFHFETPDFLGANLQHEFTIHNLPFFDTKDSQGTFKSGISKYLTIVYFTIVYFTIVYFYKVFWFVFCFLIPLLCLFCRPIKKHLVGMGLPIAPIWSGILFLLNYMLFVKLLPAVPDELEWPATEVYESVSEFLFAMVAIWLIIQFKNRGSDSSNKDVDLALTARGDS